MTIDDKPGALPNTLLSTARRRVASPSGSGLPMSRQELADAANRYLFEHAGAGQLGCLDGKYVGKLERGIYRWPNKQYREAIRHVLGASADADLGFYVTRRPAAPFQEEPDASEIVRDGRGRADAPHGATIAAGFSVDHRRLDDAFEASDDTGPPADSVTVIVMIDGALRRLRLSRRALLRAGSAGVAAPVLAKANAESMPVDPAVIDHFAALRALLVQADNGIGGFSVLPTVAQQVALIGELRQQSRGGLRDELLRAEARWSEFAGWLADDLGVAGGGTWLSQASDMAHEAADDDFCAYVFARKAQRAAVTGAHDRVLGLAQVAMRSPAASPLVRAFALTQLAYGHAVNGEQVSFANCIDRSRTIVADAKDAVGELGLFCTPHYLDLQEGEGWLRLGRPDKAVTCFTRALAAWPLSERRERALCLARTATAHLQSGDPDQAAAAGVEACRLGQPTHSDRIKREIGTLVDHVSVHRQRPAVARFIQTATAA